MPSSDADAVPPLAQGTNDLDRVLNLEPAAGADLDRGLQQNVWKASIFGSGVHRSGHWRDGSDGRGDLINDGQKLFFVGAEPAARSMRVGL